MNALSVTSSEPLATWFYYFLVSHFLCVISGFIPNVEKYLDTDSAGFAVVEVGTHFACYWLGYLLCKKVNDQLKSAAIPPRTF